MFTFELSYVILLLENSHVMLEDLVANNLVIELSLHQSNCTLWHLSEISRVGIPHRQQVVLPRVEILSIGGKLSLGA